MRLVLKPEYLLVPEGTYEAEIYKINEIVNKFSTKPQSQIVFKITSKEGCSPLVDWFNPVLHPKAKIYQLINAIGLKLSDYTKEIDLEDFIGRQLRITVKHKSKGGKTYANIVKYSKLIATA